MIRNDIQEKVAIDLLSIPALIFRGIRRKLIKTSLSESDIDVNITPLHFEILMLLEEEGTLHVAEIGSRLQIAKAQMTQLVRKLVDLNFIERTLDATDRRIINISLTEPGRKILAEHKQNVMASMQEIMSNLSDRELEELSISLKKLQAILLRLH